MQEGPTYLAKSNHCFIRTTPAEAAKHPVRFAKSWSRGRAQHHSLLETMGAQEAQGILRSLRYTALVSAVSWQCLEEVSRASLNTWLVHLFLCGSNAVCKNRGGQASTLSVQHTQWHFSQRAYRRSGSLSYSRKDGQSWICATAPRQITQRLVAATFVLRDFNWTLSTFSEKLKQGLRFI